MTISRRTLLKFASLAPAAKLVGIQMAHAEDREFRHALTLFKDIKYPEGFKNFDYTLACPKCKANQKADACASVWLAPSTISIPILSRARRGVRSRTIRC